GLFAAGGLFLALGLVRIARGAGSAAPSFAAACGALALCVVAYLLTADLRTPAEAPGRGARVAELAPKAWALPDLAPAGAPDGGEGRQPQTDPSRPGYVHVLSGDKKTADEQTAQATTAPRKDK